MFIIYKNVHEYAHPAGGRFTSLFNIVISIFLGSENLGLECLCILV